MIFSFEMDEGLSSKLFPRFTEQEVTDLILANLKTIGYDAEIKAYVQAKQEELKAETLAHQQQLQAEKNQDIQDYIAEL